VSTRDVYDTGPSTAPSTAGGEAGAAAEVSQKAREAGQQARKGARQAAGQAQSRIRQEVDHRSTQVGDQIASTARDVRSVGEELRKQGKDGPARLADQAAERAERVADYMKSTDADRLIADVESFARRRPWAVMVGGLTLGFLASRFMKASSGERYRARSGNGDYGDYGTESLPATAPAASYGATSVAGPASTGVTEEGVVPGSARGVGSDPFADDPLHPSPATDEFGIESPARDDPWSDVADERHSKGL
jgi:hypothetical protein